MSDNQQGNNPKNKQDNSRPSPVHMFNARELGTTLTEVAVEHLRSDGRDIESRWFHSPHDADVFFWCDDQKNIIKQQLTFLGQMLEWNLVEGLRTGLVVESSMAGDTSSPIIHFDDRPQKKTVEQGLEILSHMTTLDPDTKRRILRNFR
jgi:hypothetical protein